MTPCIVYECVCVCVYRCIRTLNKHLQSCIFCVHTWRQQQKSGRFSRRAEGGECERVISHSWQLSLHIPPPIYGQNYWSPSLYPHTHIHTNAEDTKWQTVEGSSSSCGNTTETPLCCPTRDKTTDIQGLSLCIAANLCLFALLSSSHRLFALFAALLKKPLFRWVWESRRPRRGLLVMRESSGAWLGKEPDRRKKIKIRETQWGGCGCGWWVWGLGLGGGCSEECTGRLRETGVELVRGGKVREAERKEGRAYLKRLCL